MPPTHPIPGRAMAWLRVPLRLPTARVLAAWLLAGCVAWCGGASALVLHDVQVPAQQSEQGHSLALNGAGTRYVLFFKVYVASLYLPQPTRDASAALAMPGPKLLRLVMLRDVSGRELADKLDTDLHANLTPARAAELAPQLSRLRNLLAARPKMASGETIELLGLPAGGLQVRVDGKPLGEAFDTPGLFDALLRIWLGPRPADGRLKDALLGDPGAVR